MVCYHAQRVIVINTVSGPGPLSRHGTPNVQCLTEQHIRIVIFERVNHQQALEQANGEKSSCEMRLNRLTPEILGGGSALCIVDHGGRHTTIGILYHVRYGTGPYDLHDF